MIAPRRLLPSMPSALALEAVERLGTATAAAAELSLTHSAVSRQLKVLEDQLGVTLTRRAGKGLALTPAGAEYARALRGHLEGIARASQRLRAGGSDRSLTLAILPAFGTHWLLPRLKGFAAAEPGLAVNLGTRLRPFDLEREGFDAAIHYGRRDWQGVEYLELARERVVAACAPELAPDGPRAAAELLALPLLQLDSRPGGWEHWFEAQGVAAGRVTGMLFDQFGPLVEAAALGLGVALLPEFLARDEFARGRLVPAAEGGAEGAGRYWLVWPAGRPVGRPLAALIDWLRAAAVSG